ncbi:MAG: hypothetical protein KF842_01670 [Caulobacter sp.]|nr:hypothetical protein [Caulobacter sp.]
MAEEGFVSMYARDFVTLAARAESGVEVEPQVEKRIGEARSHAQLMDARKGGDHLPAVADRLRHESKRDDIRTFRPGDDIKAALKRRREFLLDVADRLMKTPGGAGRASMAVRG